MGFSSQMGAVVSAAGQLEAGQASANAANYNAEVARLDASYASQAGSAQAEAASMRGAAGLGRIKASQGANNIDVNSGSAVKVQETQRGISVLNAATAENNALLEAYGYKEEAELDTQQARQAIIGSYFGAAGSLMGNASSAGPNFSGMQSGGADAGGGASGAADLPPMG